jgi:tetratricopeptide (TPR) repeat protein
MFFNMGLMLQPDSAKAYAGLGFVDLRLKEYNASVNDLTKSIQLKPGAPAYGGRAMAYYFLGRYADAVTDLTEAIRLEPAHPEFYKARAKAYDAAGDHLPAKADRKKAKQLMASSGTPAE